MLRSQKPKSNLKNSQNRAPNHPSNFELLKTTGARVHLCSLSSATGVELVRQAKAQNPAKPRACWAISCSGSPRCCCALSMRPRAPPLTRPAGRWARPAQLGCASASAGGCAAPVLSGAGASGAGGKIAHPPTARRGHDHDSTVFAAPRPARHHRRTGRRVTGRLRRQRC